MHLVRQVYNKAPPSWFDRRCGGDGRGSDSDGGGGNSGEDDGGAVEEMDQDGSDVGGPIGRVYPADWATKTKAVASAATAVVAAAAAVEEE